jgi:hypothetical protein
VPKRAIVVLTVINVVYIPFFVELNDPVEERSFESGRIDKESAVIPILVGYLSLEFWGPPVVTIAPRPPINLVAPRVLTM